MPTPTITDYLKYANLQMAAEAFLKNPLTGVESYSGDALEKALIAGNQHASRFTETQAKEFADPTKGWTVVNQIANTGSGFSGTLFKNNATGELVNQNDFGDTPAENTNHWEVAA
jgi:hypothetical protein